MHACTCKQIDFGGKYMQTMVNHIKNIDIISVNAICELYLRDFSTPVSMIIDLN